MNSVSHFRLHLIVFAIMVGCFSIPVSAQDKDGNRSVSNAGDPLHIDFVLPFKEALKKAKKENRLLFLKPIYGGVDQEGAKDYRCGSW